MQQINDIIAKKMIKRNLQAENWRNVEKKKKKKKEICEEKERKRRDDQNGQK